MATVLSTRRKLSVMYKTNDPFYQGAPEQVTPDLWVLSVRVQPYAQPTFDAHIEAWLTDALRPWMNTVIAVLYDPSDPGKVVLDQWLCRPTRTTIRGRRNLLSAAHFRYKRHDREGRPPVPKTVDPVLSAGWLRAVDQPAITSSDGLVLGRGEHGTPTGSSTPSAIRPILRSPRRRLDSRDSSR
jgi:hypothetical protein